MDYLHTVIDKISDFFVVLIRAFDSSRIKLEALPELNLEPKYGQRRTVASGGGGESFQFGDMNLTTSYRYFGVVRAEGTARSA